MAIIVSLIIIVAYCVYDRQRANTKQAIKAANDRIDAIGRQVGSLEKGFGLLVDSLPPDIRDVYIDMSGNPDLAPSGQPHDPND